MTDNTAQDSPEETQPQQSPGELLAAARSAAGQSPREVADALHLLPRQILALEADDFQQFNGDIFCKGYLRAYGRFIGVDPELLLTRYSQLKPNVVVDEQLSAQKLRTIHIQQPSKGRSIQYWCLCASIVVLTILWVNNNDSESVSSDALINQSVVIDEHDQSVFNEIAAGSGSLVVPRNDIDKATSTVGGQGIIEEQTLARATTNQTLVEPGVSVIATVPGSSLEPVAEEQLLPSGPIRQTGQLSFSFEHDCWVEIKDGDNQVIYANLKHARDTLDISGHAPFQILLGYAPGVELAYNGDPVPITINRRTNSAKLLVGDERPVVMN